MVDTRTRYLDRSCLSVGADIVKEADGVGGCLEDAYCLMLSLEPQMTDCAPIAEVDFRGPWLNLPCDFGPHLGPARIDPSSRAARPRVAHSKVSRDQQRRGVHAANIALHVNHFAVVAFTLPSSLTTRAGSAPAGVGSTAGCDTFSAVTCLTHGQRCRVRYYVVGTK